MLDTHPRALHLRAKHVARLKTESLSVMMARFWWRNVVSAVCTASSSAAWLVWPNRGVGGGCREKDSAHFQQKYQKLQCKHASHVILRSHLYG